MYSRIRDLSEDRDLNQTQIAKFYNTSIDYLLGETDCKKRYP